MSPDNELLVPYLEWDRMDKLISITNVDAQENLPNGNKRIDVIRDADYNLKATLYFEDPQDMVEKQQSFAAGTLVQGFKITGSNYEKSSTYILESCYIKNWQSHTDNVTRESLSTAEIGFGALRRKTSINEAAHLCEWYVNGPNDNVFSRVTHRELLSTRIKNRLSTGNEEFDSIKTPVNSSSSGIDFLIVKTDNLQFIIGKVPESLGPNWSSNIMIEYKTAWGSIPDASRREKISEVCSFVFGRQLLNIGYTIYDKNEHIVETYARNPQSNSAKDFCRNSDNPPVFIQSIPPNHRAEEIISQLVPEYIKHREEFRLKEALWNIWISHQMPVGPNIPILTSALESIIKGWFASTKSNGQGCFMDQKSFETLLNSEIANIKGKLEGQLDEIEVGKIISTVVHSNSFGPTERYRAFFKEIHMNLTKLEKDAIRERHKFTHGDAIFDNENWSIIIQGKYTLETLLNKVILRMLSYSGDFIDRSTSPWREHQDITNFTSA